MQNNQESLEGFDEQSYFDLYEEEMPPYTEMEVPAWADTTMAQAEEKKWAKLDEVLAKNDTNWATVYGWVVVVFTIVFSLIFLSSLIIWSWHYMMPENCLWLSDAQLSKIQSVLFSGGMGAVISSVVKKQMDRVNPLKT